MAPRASLIRVGIWPHPRSLQDPVWPQLTPFCFSLLLGAAGRNREGHAQRRGCGTQRRGRSTRGLTRDVVLELSPSLSQVPHLHEGQVRRSISLVSM